MAKPDYDHKLKITLTLTEEEASDLLDTLAAGVSARYAPTLQARSNAIKKLVAKRYDAAVMARRRARLRADQRKLSTEYITAIGRASIKAADAGTDFTAEQRAEIRASFYPAEAARILDDRSNDDAKV